MTTSIQGAIDTALAGDLQQLRQFLSQAAQSADAGMRSDSLFLEGILRMIEGNAESGVAIIRESHKTGRYSPQLFEWLGQLWQLTPDDGTAIRALLQRLRLLPFQPIGKLAAVDQWTEAEPWWFSRKVTHFFPPKQT